MKINFKTITIIVLCMFVIFGCGPTTPTPTPAPTQPIEQTPSNTETPEPFTFAQFDASWIEYIVDKGGIGKFNIEDLGFNSCIAIEEAQDESPRVTIFSQEILPTLRPINGKRTVVHVKCPGRTLGDVDDLAKQVIDEKFEGDAWASALFVRSNTVDCHWWNCYDLVDNWSYTVRGSEGLDNSPAYALYTGNFEEAWVSGYPQVGLYTCKEDQYGQEQYIVIIAPETKPEEAHGPCPSGVESVTGVIFTPTTSYDYVGLQLALIAKAELLILERGNYLPLHRYSTYEDLIGWPSRGSIVTNRPAELGDYFQPTTIPDTP